jgi:hypothetical protein
METEAACRMQLCELRTLARAFTRMRERDDLFSTGTPAGGNSGASGRTESPTQQSSAWTRPDCHELSLLDTNGHPHSPWDRAARLASVHFQTANQ